MKFPNSFDLKPTKILKIAGLASIVIVIIILVFRLITPFFNSVSLKTDNKIAPVYDNIFSAEEVYNESSKIAYDKDDDDDDEIGLSIQNIAMSSPSPVNISGSMGGDAEEFEVTEYSANIETRSLENTCNAVIGLKSRDDVIFENSNEYEKGCNYNFKVKHDSVKKILAIIKGLNPRELNENTYTIKRLIDDYTSETEILEKKMSSIEETLAIAVNAYDDITKIAIRTQDVESLAKIIDSKVKIIERLTQERININAQLERLERAKAEQLDRLEYTYFNVYIFENKFIDGQNLKDSWKVAVKSFVYDINKVVQGITINLTALLFLTLQYLIYLFIILIIVKYCWKITKIIWKK